MLNKIKLENFKNLTPEKQILWAQKSQYQRKDEYTPEAFYPRAGIWAEFGKIICISVGHFVFEGQLRKFRITTFSGKEKKLLLEFKSLLNQHFKSLDIYFVHTTEKSLTFLLWPEEC